MPSIHPSAFIDPSAQIHETSTIGPQAFVDADVTIGPNCEIMHGAHIARWTSLGEGNRVFPGATLGHEPQDLGYKGEASFTRIGNFNTFREGVTVHRGDREGTETIIGDHNLFMVNTHVAHNCRVANHVIMVNGSGLAGFVQVDDRVIISGNCLIHQFVRVGTLALMRGGSRLTKDLPPYCVSDGINWARTINLVGLKRNGLGLNEIRAIKETFKTVFRGDGTLENRLATVRELHGEIPAIEKFLNFISDSKRGIVSGQE